MQNAISLCALAVLVCLTGCQSLPQEQTARSASLASGAHTVSTGLAADSSRSTFVAAIKASGADEKWASIGPVTVIAPSNKAFSTLPSGTLDAWMKPENKDRLAQVVNCHLVAADLSRKTLSGMIKQNGGSYPVITVGGCVLTATQVRNVITLTDQNGTAAILTGPHRHRQNGEIHGTTKVFTPAGSLARN